MNRARKFLLLPLLGLGLAACGQTAAPEVAAAPSPAAHMVAVQLPAVPQADPAEEFLTRLFPAGDVDPATASTLVELGQNVCDGFTAQVPVATMTGTLAEQHGMTAAEADEFVAAARSTLCEPRV
jgi:hypothetical protein